MFNLNYIVSNKNLKKLSLALSKAEVKFDCSLCVDSALYNLSKYIEKTNLKKVEILASFQTERAFKIQTEKVRKRYKVSMINREDLNLPPNFFDNGPLLFTVNSSMRINDLFIPVKGYPRLDSLYFSVINQKLKNRAFY